MSRSSLPLLVLLGGAGACAAAPAPGTSALDPSVPLAPDDHGTIWDYLRGRYDSDGDGTITPAEYDRPGEGFARLDRTGDGLLDEADFSLPSADEMRERMRGLRTLLAVGRYFQADDELTLLEQGELDWRITEMDRDGDDAVSPAELAEATTEVRSAIAAESGYVSQFLGDADPWTHLEPLDTDGDGALQRHELLAWFEERADGEQVLEIDLDPSRDEEGSATMSGPPPGELAPDFTLRPPHGGEAVRLSAFRDERPVALIFGSYT